MTQELTWLDPKVIETDWGTQHRPELVPSAILEYAQAMDSSEWEWERDPAMVAYDGERYGLIGGFHRLHAAKQAGVKKFGCIVIQATRREAVLASMDENSKHGERLTNKGKRNKVQVLLRDEEWSRWSDREIARRCGVSDRLVNNMRAELTANGSQSPTHRIGADGRVTDVSNIGKSAPKPEPKAPGWVAELEAEKWYPVKTFIRHIWNDPHEDAQGIYDDPRYRFSFQVARGANLSKPEFWNFTMGDVAPAPSEEQLAAVKQDIEEEALSPGPSPKGEGSDAPTVAVGSHEGRQLVWPAREWRYQVTMSAQCKHCVELKWDATGIYRFWRPDATPGIWVCQRGHRISDALMDIVEDEPAEAEPQPGVAIKPVSEVPQVEDFDDEEDGLSVEDEQWLVDVSAEFARAVVERLTFKIEFEAVLDYVREALEDAIGAGEGV